MGSVVVFHLEFAGEFGDLEAAVRDEIMKYVVALKQLGPSMERPRSATLDGVKYSKLKELRLTVKKVEWRIAYAFDTEQQCILLAGGSKNGVDEERFYKGLVAKSEKRLEAHENDLAARSKVASTKSNQSSGKKGKQR